MGRSLRRLGRLLAREPVRVRLYGVIAALVAILVARGLITGYEAPLWTALAAAVLGVAGVETARDRVTPWQPGDPTPTTDRLTRPRHRAPDD